MEDRDMISTMKKRKGHISLRTTSKTRYLRQDSANGEMKKM